MFLEVWNAILNFRYISVVWIGLVVIGVVTVYFQLTVQLRRFIQGDEYKVENVNRFFFHWRYVFMFTGTGVIIFLFSDTFELLGLSLGLIVTFMGWGIRGPVLNLAAWLLIILKRPYRVGDRVSLNGIVGDVEHISITHTLMEQVGGSVDGEDKSGRSVMIPNQHLFKWTVINYTRDEKYLLDEVLIELTYNSDITRAERIMYEEAAQITAEAIEEFGELPYVRFEFIPSGVVAKLRYRVRAVDRQRVSTQIIERIFTRFGSESEIHFAYMKMESLLIPKGEQLQPPQYFQAEHFRE